MRKTLLGLGLFLWLVATAGTTLAAEFPYEDPYYATITAAILKADEKDRAFTYEDFKLRGKGERDSVPFYGATRNKITVRLWRAEKKQAPVVVLVAGLGGSAASSYHNYLGYQLAKRGFHALVVPSPFHWSFALAASESGYPGITRDDARDLERLIHRALAEVPERAGVRFGRAGLLGVSMGALEGAYLAERDAGAQRFSSILLVNPPVKPLASAARLTELRAAGDALDAAAKKSLREKIVFFGYQAVVQTSIQDPAYFAHIPARLPTTEAERRFLIGDSLQEFLASLVFTTQQVQDLGILPAPVATEDADPRLKAAEAYTFSDYMNKFLLPALSRQRGEELTYEKLAGDVDMPGVESHLRADTRVRLLHNADDFIVNGEELAWLAGIFGERMRLFPRGGHMGNLWFPENLDLILSSFDGLKE